MLEGKVVFQGTSKKGIPFLIRYIKSGDEMAMTEYINTLSQEKTFISYQGEIISLEEEKAFLDEERKKNSNHNGVMLVAFSEDRLIGITGIDMKSRVTAHVGVLGISLVKEFRGQGIGRTLLKTVLSEAEKNITHLRIVILGVFSNNLLAITLYKSCGFKEFARLPKGIVHQGKYVDHIDMYLNILPTQ